MEENILKPFELFGQETYEDALKKNSEENKSFAKTKHFKMDSEGTYTVRILPIAPVQVDGKWQLDRKGYEYPVKTQFLKIENPSAKGKNDKNLFVNVCHSSYSGLSVDLIDAYIEAAFDLYSSDEKLISKIQESGFEGGLKWNSQRCMYVFDYKKRSEGIQLLTISYPQYKELEERKLNVWKKLLKNDPKYCCPISSIKHAFPVEITRKKEGKKVSYAFNIDILTGSDELTEEEMNALMEAPRLPDILYRYTRFHFEATIEYLKQYDAKMGIDVMSSEIVQDAINKIKLELPADDKSHFKFDQKSNDSNNESNNQDDLDSLWDRLEKIEDEGLGIKSEEYQELRDDICKYIEDNDLAVRTSRNKTNKDLLEAIEEALKDGNFQDNDEAPETNEHKENEEESDDDNVHEKDEYNEDTNEPARRAARTERRRVR